MRLMTKNCPFCNSPPVRVTREKRLKSRDVVWTRHLEMEYRCGTVVRDRELEVAGDNCAVVGYIYEKAIRDYEAES